MSKQYFQGGGIMGIYIKWGNKWVHIINGGIMGTYNLKTRGTLIHIIIEEIMGTYNLTK